MTIPNQHLPNSLPLPASAIPPVSATLPPQLPTPSSATTPSHPPHSGPVVSSHPSSIAQLPPGLPTPNHPSRASLHSQWPNPSIPPTFPQPKTSPRALPQDTIQLDNLFNDFSDTITPLTNVRDPLPFSLAPAPSAEPEPDAFPDPGATTRRRPTNHVSPPVQNLAAVHSPAANIQPAAPRGPLSAKDPDSLSPAERRKLRMELRRGRVRTRRAGNPSPSHVISRPRPDRAAPSLANASARADSGNQSVLDKKAARVIRNREVALKARQAAKTKMKNLEEENSTLKTRANSLEVENSTLKSQIEMLRKSGGGSVPWESDMGIGGVVGAMTN